ncbi:hypothetical protein E4U61_003925 [Claviceps capensis]|nr:hypothetical protein E4U61_003925 [Claviceps capensis]
MAFTFVFAKFTRMAMFPTGNHLQLFSHGAKPTRTNPTAQHPSISSTPADLDREAGKASVDQRDE